MIEVVKVSIREYGKSIYYNPRGMSFAVGTIVILEADRGVDYGYVLSEVEQLESLNSKDPLKAVIRLADQKDVEKIQGNKEKAHNAMRDCKKKIDEHNLPMKLVDAEYSFDVSKLIFYFTAEGRVDFRELVKELAAMFKVRIELRQIGVRDEAKMFGGVAHCGRGLCCSTFLRDFEPVTIKMAKEQHLSLNPTKISGLCGRLMCCLGYENDIYKMYAKDIPSIGDEVKAKEGAAGKVVDVNVLHKKVMVSFPDKTVWIDFNPCACPGKKCPVHSKFTFKMKKKKEEDKEEDVYDQLPEETE